MQDDILNELINGGNEETEPTETQQAQTPAAVMPTENNEAATEPAADETPKEEKRGRHKKTYTCDKCKAKKMPQQDSAPEAAKGSTKISDTNPLNFDEFKTAQPVTNQAGAPQQEINAAKYITGGMLLILIDSIAPEIGRAHV